MARSGGRNGGRPPKQTMEDIRALDLSMQDLADFLELKGFDAQKCTDSQRAMLLAWSKTDVLYKACALTGINHSTYYRWCDSDPRFEEMCRVAKELGYVWRVGRLETMLDARAATSDQLLMFALERLDRKRYGRNEPINMNFGLNVDLSGLTTEELKKLAAFGSGKQEEEEQQGKIIDVTP